MKSFVEASTAHTQLIYGRTNDIFCGSDMVIRSFETQLHQVLGAFDCLVFYDGTGLRGAYCVDERSAALFFPDSAQQAQTAPGLGRRALKPISIAEALGHAGTPAGPEEQPRPACEPVPMRRYGQRNYTLDEFVSTVLSVLNRPGSPRLAIVLENILLQQQQSLQLLNTLQRDLERSYFSNGSICLFVAPVENESAIADRLGAMEGFFSEKREQGSVVLRPEAIWHLGAPETDEIQNLLARLCVIGTGKGNRLLCQAPVSRLAEAIAYAGRQKAGETQTTFSLSGVLDRLCAYLDGPDAAPLCEESIYRLWEVKKPPVHALDELNRPGWEPLYAYMKQVCDKATRLKQEHPPCAVERRDFLSRRFAAADREDMPETPMSAPSFFLLGPPGVGKTTAARLIGRCFYEHGLLKKGHVVETSQADLVSSYVGGIHIKVQQKCCEAEEGVLLIDDAKTLLTRDAGDQHAPTGKVILEALVPEMTRRRFCCIISGYQETRELLKCDAGLMRRFGDGKGINVVELQGYTPEVLERVMLRVIADKGRTLDPALITPRANGKTPLRCMLERVYHERDRSSFGNADWVQKTVMDAISAAESSSAALTEADFIGQGGIRAEFFQDQYDDQTIAGVLDDFRKQYVGMDQVEAFLKTVGRTVIDARQRGKSLEDLSCSAFILSGNPGSGKTSATKALSRLLFSLELLGTPEPIVCSASSLNSSYVHGNMEKLNELVKEAQDKRALLFIDEASQFLDGREKDLKAFVEPLTDHSHPFMVVLACYPQDADRLLACDPGNARRYMRLDLPDYSGDELHRILLRMADAQGMQVASDASGMLRAVCEAIARFSPPDNKNAGAVENLLRFSLEKIHLERINPDCLPNPPAYATPEAFTYTAEDVNLLLDRAAVPLTPEQCRWVREQLQGV